MSNMSALAKAKENPYLNAIHSINLKRKGILVGTADKILYDEETQQMSNLKVIGRYEEVDQERFVKIFVNRFSQIMELSRTGGKGLQYIMSQLKPNSDEVYVYTIEMLDYCDWKYKSQCYRALNELVDKQIIYPSTRLNIWFINPAIMFNGNRLTFIEQYRLKKDKEPEVEVDQKMLPVSVEFENKEDYIRGNKGE